MYYSGRLLFFQKFGENVSFSGFLAFYFKFSAICVSEALKKVSIKCCSVLCLCATVPSSVVPYLCRIYNVLEGLIDTVRIILIYDFINGFL